MLTNSPLKALESALENLRRSNPCLPNPTTKSEIVSLLHQQAQAGIQLSFVPPPVQGPKRDRRDPSVNFGVHILKSALAQPSSDESKDRDSELKWKYMGNVRYPDFQSDSDDDGPLSVRERTFSTVHRGLYYLYDSQDRLDLGDALSRAYGVGTDHAPHGLSSSAVKQSTGKGAKRPKGYSLTWPQSDLPPLKRYCHKHKLLPREAATLWPLDLLPFFKFDNDHDGSARKAMTERVRNSQRALAKQWETLSNGQWAHFKWNVVRTKMSKRAEAQARAVLAWHNHLIKEEPGLRSVHGPLYAEDCLDQPPTRLKPSLD